MNLAELLGASAQRVPSALALVSGTRPITTYRELAQRVAGRAHTLSRQHGIGPGHQVAIYATNSPEYLEYLFAIWWAGATAIPLSADAAPPGGCGASRRFAGVTVPRVGRQGRRGRGRDRPCPVLEWAEITVADQQVRPREMAADDPA